MSTNKADLFNKVSEGVADLYQRKASFHKSNFKNISKKNLNCFRFFGIVALALEVFTLWLYAHFNAQVNGPHFGFVVFMYYSLWGFVAAIGGLAFSILASINDAWYNIAYFFTESSAAINIQIMVLYWGFIYPFLIIFEAPKAKTNLELAQLLGVGALIHTFPFLGCLVNVCMSDITLDTTHWKRMALLWCPCYMVCNIYACMNIPSGSIYQVENWKDRPVLSAIFFVIFGFVQGGLFVCFAKCIARCKPKSKPDDDEESMPKNYNAGSNTIN